MVISAWYWKFTSGYHFNTCNNAFFPGNSYVLLDCFFLNYIYWSHVFKNWKNWCGWWLVLFYHQFRGFLIARFRHGLEYFISILINAKRRSGFLSSSYLIWNIPLVEIYRKFTRRAAVINFDGFSCVRVCVWSGLLFACRMLINRQWWSTGILTSRCDTVFWGSYITATLLDKVQSVSEWYICRFLIHW